MPNHRRYYIGTTILILTYTVSFSTNSAQYCQNLEINSPPKTPAKGEFILNDEQQVINKTKPIIADGTSLYNNVFKISANRVAIDKIQQQLSAQQNVQLSGEQLTIYAHHLVVNRLDTTPTIVIEQPKYQANNGHFWGRASQSISQKKYHFFKQASFSTCPPSPKKEEKTWQIKASSLTLDFAQNKGVAKNVRLELLDQPIFYLPYYQWVLSGPASGFLTPEFAFYSNNNNQSGYEVSIPYYFYLAPHKDLTLSLDYLSLVGYGIGANYHHLFKQSDLALGIRYFGDDDQSLKSRWLLNLDKQLTLNADTRLGIIINRVSDKDYFDDIEHRHYAEKTLNSSFKLQHQKNDLSLVLEHDEQQLISGSPSYLRQPALQTRYHQQILAGDFNTLVDITNFAHQETTSTTGIRTHLQLNYGYQLYHSNLSLRPEINFYHSQYNLDNQNKQTRSIANVNLDGTWHFQRLASDYVYRLSPRAFYNYTQEKQQDLLPNFDSSKINQSYESLFTPNIWSGFDRIQAANNITLGLASGIYGNKNYQPLLEMNVAQTWYKKKSYNPFNTNHQKSNIILEAALHKAQQSFNVDLQYNPQKQGLSREHYLWYYKPNSQNKWQVSYHKQTDIQDEQEQLSADNGRFAQIYGSRKLSRNNELFLGVQYDLENNISNRRIYGINYQNCCFSLQISQQRSYSDNNNYHDEIRLSFDLIGLTSQNKKRQKKSSGPSFNHLF